MQNGDKFLHQLKDLIAANAGLNYFDEKDFEARLQKMLKDPTYLEVMNSAPCIVGLYNFREGYYIFLSKQMEYELGIDPNELIGKDNTAKAMGAIYPAHGELWFFRTLPTVMEYYKNAGSREEVMKISYSICIQLLTHKNERKWFYTETDLLDADENGTPLISIFYMSNIDDVKKDDLVYYSVRKKGNSGHELLFNSSFPPEQDGYTLTKREAEILKLVGAGKSTLEIADELHLSKLTIDTHRKNILEKTNTESLTELLSILMYKGLI